MSNNQDLYDFCLWNNTEIALSIMQTSDDVDIFYEDGRCIKFAIKNNNTEIIKSLLDYFENRQFSNKDDSYDNRYKYQFAKNELAEILQDATDTFDISEEMKKVLSPYIDFEDDSSDRGLDSEMENTPEIPSNNDQISQVDHVEASTLDSLLTELTEENLNKCSGDIISIEERIEGLFIENTPNKMVDGCNQGLDDNGENTTIYDTDDLERMIAYRNETIGDVHHDDSHI